jgi:hypothetical protein
MRVNNQNRKNNIMKLDCAYWFLCITVASRSCLHLHEQSSITVGTMNSFSLCSDPMKSRVRNEYSLVAFIFSILRFKRKSSSMDAHPASAVYRWRRCCDRMSFATLQSGWLLYHSSDARVILNHDSCLERIHDSTAVSTCSACLSG